MNFDPLASDPIEPDRQYPAANAPVTFESDGARVLGVLHIAPGAGPHPTIVFLHGIPGYERNFDLAQVLRRAGYNVLVFHYRGAWGSGGAFSFTHVLEDVRAALAFLRDPRARQVYRVDRARLILMGHSLGGFAALATAVTDPEIRAVVSLALYDLGAIAAAVQSHAGYSEATTLFFEWCLPPLRDTSPQNLLDEVIANGARWHLPQHSLVLAELSLLLIDATRDTIAPPVLHHQPLVAALQARGAPDMTHVTFDTDHAFCAKRVALAREIVGWLEKQA